MSFLFFHFIFVLIYLIFQIFAFFFKTFNLLFNLTVFEDHLIIYPTRKFINSFAHRIFLIIHAPLGIFTDFLALTKEIAQFIKFLNLIQDLLLKFFQFL